jgi:regulator of replication initiation timing
MLNEQTVKELRREVEEWREECNRLREENERLKRGLVTGGSTNNSAMAGAKRSRDDEFAVGDATKRARV